MGIFDDGHADHEFHNGETEIQKLKFGSSLGAVIVILIFLLMFSLFFVIILPPLLHQIDVLTHLDYNLVFEPLQNHLIRPGNF
ncbi:MAG: hypothetical protein IPH57_17115 [Saprospiraceae bacterium]|nr:hypothetical protein [Saprospiraceae bacterium]